jgi:endonuclease YncB( thermonuclease family)
MKLFIFCLWFSIHTCIFASESKQSLFIVDGDSVNINVVLFLDLAQAPMEELGDKTDLKMRIAGIDTPEIKQTCEIEEGKSIDCGVLTKDYLQKLLESEPGDLVIQPIGVDYYHRILIRLFKGETDIGRKMVEEGMSYSYDSTYKIEETYAKENKLGFWNFFKPPVNPKIWRKEH